jgi:hypothetical protein
MLCCIEVVMKESRAKMYHQLAWIFHILMTYHCVLKHCIITLFLNHESLGQPDFATTTYLHTLINQLYIHWQLNPQFLMSFHHPEPAERRSFVIR